MAVVSNCSSSAASRRERRASSKVFSCVETEIFFLTGNAIKYFAFYLVTFILYNIMSLIVSNFPLSTNSFAPASMGIPIVVTKFEGPLCVTLRSFTSII